VLLYKREHIIIYTYKNGRTDDCLFVCSSVGMCRANGNPNSCNKDLVEILQAHFYLSKEDFDAGLNPPPTPGGPETLKPEGQRCSAGCILTRAALGTSAIFDKKDA